MNIPGPAVARPGTFQCSRAHGKGGPPSVLFLYRKPCRLLHPWKPLLDRCTEGNLTRSRTTVKRRGIFQGARRAWQAADTNEASCFTNKKAPPHPTCGGAVTGAGRLPRPPPPHHPRGTRRPVPTRQELVPHRLTGHTTNGHSAHSTYQQHVAPFKPLAGAALVHAPHGLPGAVMLLQLLKLRLDHECAVRRIRILRKVILMVLFRRIELLERLDLRDDL